MLVDEIDEAGNPGEGGRVAEFTTSCCHEGTDADLEKAFSIK